MFPSFTDHINLGYSIIDIRDIRNEKHFSIEAIHLLGKKHFFPKNLFVLDLKF